MVKKKNDIIKKFSKVDTSNFPNFYNYEKPLEQGLWILWVAKEKLNIKKMTAEQITKIILEVMEISVDSKSLNNSFTGTKKKKTQSKIHIYHEGENVLFEIMKPGKDYLLSLIKEGSIKVFYFEPGKKFTSKKTLSKNILQNLSRELSIVDSYCSERTLDILNKIDNKTRFLTRVENLREKERKRFLRELEDFKSEKSNIEFRNYPHSHIHDRFIISSNCLVVLGHSIKDLGSKESFAIVLNKDTSKDIFEALFETFNRRWKISKPL